VLRHALVQLVLHHALHSSYIFRRPSHYPKKSSAFVGLQKKKISRNGLELSESRQKKKKQQMSFVVAGGGGGKGRER
jgi:hypothetical protein